MPRQPTSRATPPLTPQPTSPPAHTPPCPAWCARTETHVLVRRDGAAMACHYSVEVDGVGLCRVDVAPVGGPLDVGPLWLVGDHGCVEVEKVAPLVVARCYEAAA